MNMKKKMLSAVLSAAMLVSAFGSMSAYADGAASRYKNVALGNSSVSELICDGDITTGMKFTADTVVLDLGEVYDIKGFDIFTDGNVTINGFYSDPNGNDINWGSDPTGLSARYLRITDRNIVNHMQDSSTLNEIAVYGLPKLGKNIAEGNAVALDTAAEASALFDGDETTGYAFPVATTFVVDLGQEYTIASIEYVGGSYGYSYVAVTGQYPGGTYCANPIGQTCRYIWCNTGAGNLVYEMKVYVEKKPEVVKTNVALGTNQGTGFDAMFDGDEATSYSWPAGLTACIDLGADYTISEIDTSGVGFSFPYYATDAQNAARDYQTDGNPIGKTFRYLWLAYGGAVDVPEVRAYVYTEVAESFTVTYMQGDAGGTAPVDTYEYEDGAYPTVLGSGELVKTGFEFVGWSTLENSEEAEFIAGDRFVISSDVVLYPVWKEIAREVSISDTDAFNNGETCGIRYITSVTKGENDVVEYFGTWIIPEIIFEEHFDELNREVKYDGDLDEAVYSADIVDIPSEFSDVKFLGISFVKFAGVADVVTGFKSVSVDETAE